MAQRLVRKLCPFCRKEIPVEGVALHEIERTLEGIEDRTAVPADHSKMWSAVGCDNNNTGYKGRVGIYEAILMNENIEHSVQSGGSDREIWIAAKGEGILTMKQDGVLKVLGMEQRPSMSSNA